MQKNILNKTIFIIGLLAVVVCGSFAVQNGREAYSARIFKENNTDEFVFGFDIEPPSLDPQTNIYLNGMSIQNMIFDTLVIRGEDNAFLPALAESWEYTQSGAIRFNLRQDVYFHNGDQMTAEDVKFSIERMTLEENSAVYFAAFDAEKTTVLAPFVIDVAFKMPAGNAFALLSSPRGAILPQSYFNKVGSEEFALNPVGTGAFKFVQWKRGSEITLVRNEHYYGSPPAYKFFKAKFLLDDSARAWALKNGEIDAAVCSYTDEVHSLTNGEGYKSTARQSYRYYTLIFNSQAYFNNKELRQAFAHAVKTQKLLKDFGSQAELMYSAMPTGMFAAQAQQEYKFDFYGAKKTFKTQHAGLPATFTLTVMEGEVMEKIAASLKNFWENAGVQVSIEVLDQMTFAQRIKNGEYEMYIYTAMPSTGDPAQVFEHLLQENGALGSDDYNFLKEVIEKAEEELNEEKRLEYYAQVQQYLHENYLEIPLISETVSLAACNYVLDIEASPNFILDLRKVKINYKTP